MTESNTVDVILTCFNEGKTIKRALESIKSQKSKFISKVIVIDNNSSDNSWEKILEFCEHEKNFNCFVQSKAGLPAARNMGIRKSTAKYIAFLDGDDYWMPRKIEKQVIYMERKGANFSFTDTFVERETGSAVFVCKDLPNELHAQTEFLLRYSPAIYPSTVMMRRDLLSRVGEFDEDLLRAQDTLMWLRVSVNTPMYKINCALSSRTISESSLGFDYRRKRPYVLRAISKFLADYPEFQHLERDARFSVDMHFLSKSTKTRRDLLRPENLLTVLRHPLRRSMYGLIFGL
ncbi:glycosyltransferase family 2 protein [Ovoidimarina sediminis]|uniref:glycosyltransferase family 2 protein n=1 Tax=Ovoidimarina sediminis TaxID=3079856 RepID=UPI00290F964A|nr:glycosyltransferase family A protein [Rhodophyticola sp. MJ-SS7]MDU8946152.1 glycosyltransferase family A protein [Rhodophyticola sp. MJ-SS7]